VVVEAEVKEEQGRPLLGVNGGSALKKDLTGSTLLEMFGNPIYRPLAAQAELEYGLTPPQPLGLPSMHSFGLLTIW
jgi:hypothetical protein